MAYELLTGPLPSRPRAPCTGCWLYDASLERSREHQCMKVAPTALVLTRALQRDIARLVALVNGARAMRLVNGARATRLEVR